MKKLFLLVAAVAMLLPSCQKINEAIDNLGNRLDALENETIPTIDEQIAAINLSLDALDKTDKELKGYIDGLQATADNLQEQINTTNTKIDEVKAALQGEISTAKADVVAQLEAVKTELEGELATINATIENLKAKDAELDKKIADLKSYVDTELGKTTDWVNATFATLTQYNALVAEVTAIKGQIVAINQSIADLETRLTTKINEDIATAVSTLNADIKQKVKEITDGYTEAVKNAKEEVIAAYKAAIATAISNLEASLKSWVGEQLSNYYTIAQVDSMLATLTQEINCKLEAQKAYLEGLISELSEQLTKNISDNKELIDALREDLSSAQDEIATNKLAIADNSEKISKNATKITSNAQAIAENSEDIEGNSQKIEENKSLIEANKTLINNNKSAITSLQSNIDTATKAIAKNAEDIAKNAALISANATAIGNNSQAITDNATEIANLKTSLETTKSEITEAYKKAIEEAISTNNGVIDTKIANEVATINTRINNEVAAINATIKALTERIKSIESEISSIKQQIAEILGSIADMKEDIAKLLARIQSVSYIPTHSDGKATVKYNGSTSQVTLNFEVSPKDAVAELAKVWEEALNVKAVYTETRAVPFVDMPIVAFGTDTQNGVISVTASGENLSAPFFADMQEASVRLAISDGNCSVMSEYIPMVVKEVTDEIWYTSTDGKVVTPYQTDVFGANIISNIYENGVGVIKFDGDVTKIGTRAFYNCTSLKSITIPNSVTEVGEFAFYHCSDLLDITLHEGIISIGSSAFYSCELLTSITIPNSVTIIGDHNIFNRCKGLAAFYGKFASLDHRCLVVDNVLKSFAPNGVTEYTIAEGITSIGEYAFVHCDQLTSITIPNSVTSIEYIAFAGCSSLTNVIIPNSVTSIKGQAFDRCTSLKSITIPDSVTTIRSYAFRACTSLEEVYCKATTPPTGGEDMFKDNASGRKIYVPALSVDAYKAADGWKDYADYIVADPSMIICYTSSDDNVVTPYRADVFGANIVSNTYRDGQGIIIFDAPITSIGDDAFFDCTSLTSITIPDSVTSIGSSAFYGCTSLTSVTIGNSVTTIGANAFAYCTELAVVNCNVTTPPTIGTNVFAKHASDFVIYVPKDTIAKYCATANWGVYNIYITNVGGSVPGGSLTSLKVGDLVYKNGAIGVVFNVSYSTIKIVSVKETSATWYNAKTWCSSYGTGWYLPTFDELELIYDNKSAINSTLSANRYTTLETGYYWSSTEYSSSHAYGHCFSGSYYYGPKNNTYNVRAILAF